MAALKLQEIGSLLTEINSCEPHSAIVTYIAHMSASLQRSHITQA
jgi:hypothetical protein